MASTRSSTAEALKTHNDSTNEFAALQTDARAAVTGSRNETDSLDSVAVLMLGLQQDLDDTSGIKTEESVSAPDIRISHGKITKSTAKSQRLYNAIDNITVEGWQAGGNSIPYNHLKKKLMKDPSIDWCVGFDGEQVCCLFAWTSAAKSEDNKQILLLWTKDGYRRQHCATRLILKSLDDFCDDWYVQSGPDDHPNAKKLYKKLRFKDNKVSFGITVKALRDVIEAMGHKQVVNFKNMIVDLTKDPLVIDLTKDESDDERQFQGGHSTYTCNYRPNKEDEEFALEATTDRPHAASNQRTKAVPVAKAAARNAAVNQEFQEEQRKEAKNQVNRDLNRFRKFAELIKESNEYRNDLAANEQLLNKAQKNGGNATDRANAKDELKRKFSELWDKAQERRPTKKQPKPPPKPTLNRGISKFAKELTFPLVPEEERTKQSHTTLSNRMNKLTLKGDRSDLATNIHPLAPGVPLYMGFRIVGLPMIDMRQMVIGYGDPKYTKLYTEQANNISSSSTKEQENISEPDLDKLRSSYDEFKQEIGNHPKWVAKKNKRSSYMMDSWFMRGKTADSAVNTPVAQEMGMPVALGVSHLSIQRYAISNILNIAEEAICLVLKESVIEYFENATPKFYANHGLVRTGNHVKSQVLHGDHWGIFRSKLFAKILNGGTPTAQELVDAGYVIDLPLSEEGRPLKIAIPDRDKRQFVIDVVYGPYGSFIVRSMALPHGEHGGSCGNAVWHAILFSEGGAKLFFGEKLDKLDSHLLEEGEKSDDAEGAHFEGWSIDWKDKKELAPKDWMKRGSQALKKRGTEYAETLFLSSQHQGSLMGLPRWLLSPTEIDPPAIKKDTSG